MLYLLFTCNTKCDINITRVSNVNNARGVMIQWKNFEVQIFCFVFLDVGREVENLCIEYDNHLVDKSSAAKNGEWEELGNELSNTSIVDASDSETDEFCDTSDEPLEVFYTAH